MFRKTPDGPVAISPKDGVIKIPFETELPVKVSPVKLMGPLPVATTLAPTWSSVTMKAWAGWTEKSDVTAIPKTISGRSFLGEAFMQ